MSQIAKLFLDVAFTIEGRDDGATPVLMGNHRDAWVFGAADPNSGTASLLEVAKGLGQLRKVGFIDLRSWLGGWRAVVLMR